MLMNLAMLFFELSFPFPLLLDVSELAALGLLKVTFSATLGSNGTPSVVRITESSGIKFSSISTSGMSMLAKISLRIVATNSGSRIYSASRQSSLHITLIPANGCSLSSLLYFPRTNVPFCLRRKSFNEYAKLVFPVPERPCSNTSST